MSQAKTQKTSSLNTTRSRIPEVLCWAIVPSQKNPQSPLEWYEYRLQGQDSIAVKASKRLISEGQLVNRYAGTVLRMELDKIPLWRGNHVSTKQLAEDFAQYTYLPRLISVDLLLAAINDGVKNMMWQQDTFAYADVYDENEKRYKGLKIFQHTSAAFNDHAVVVKSDIAQAQLDKEVAVILTIPSGTSTSTEQTVSQTSPTPSFPNTLLPVVEKTHKRFYATHKLDATRLERDTHRLVSEVIQHVTGLMGADVNVSIEVNAKFDNNIPDDIIRTVSENCRTLGVNFSFEEE